MKILITAIIVALIGLLFQMDMISTAELSNMVMLAPLFGLVLAGGFPGKAMFDTAQPGGEHAEDVSPTVKILSPQVIPLLSAIGIDPSPIANIRHEWLEDELIPDQDTLLNNLLAVADGATSTITVANSGIYQIGELISIGQIPNNEPMMVSAIPNATSIQVTRGYGECVPVAHASGSDILLAGEVSIEGDDAPDNQNSNMDRPYNISHIFNYKVAMTGTRRASIRAHLGDIGDEWVYEKMKRIKEFMRDLEAAILFSDWNMVGGNPTLGTAAVRRSMRGIIPFFQFGVRYNTGGAATVPANCYRNVGGVNFTYDNFRTWQQSIVYNNGAQEGQANLLLVPPILKESLGKWKRGAQGLMTVQTTQDAQTVTELVGYIETDYGTVWVIMVPRLRHFGNVSILLCSELVKPKSFVERSIHSIPLGAVGDRDEEELVGEYGLEMIGLTQGWHSLCYGWGAL